jgi:Flp pilus assembly protein TadB
MAKKTLIFVVMVAVSIVVILSFVGWSQTNQKRELEKKQKKMIISQKLQEIKIVAVGQRQKNRLSGLPQKRKQK